MKSFIIIALLNIGSILFVNGQDSIAIDKKILNFSVSYTGDNVNNLSGGIKKGSSYLGMANIDLLFDTENAGLWKGGQFYIKATQTHGAMPSADLIGDVQIVSNVEAGNHTFLQELIFKQAINEVELTLGLQDLNMEFANSQYSSLFLNSSFGILPLISGNISAPIFPLTSLAVTVKWNVSEKISWLNAIYDGSPTGFDSNPNNLNWQFNSGDGILAVSEVHFDTNLFNRSGIYKVGMMSHNHVLEQDLPDSINHHICGIYTHIDQEIWSQNEKSFGLFLQVGYSPSANLTNDFFIGMGLNYTGIFNSKGNDILALGFAREHFTNEFKPETVIELSYQYQITKNIYLQPDFQYVVNPAGTEVNLDNAVVGNLRFGLSF